MNMLNANIAADTGAMPDEGHEIVPGDGDGSAILMP
jgi:hypothetical protein